MYCKILARLDGVFVILCHQYNGFIPPVIRLLALVVMMAAVMHV